MAAVVDHAASVAVKFHAASIQARPVKDFFGITINLIRELLY
jgi:hypothetical protein